MFEVPSTQCCDVSLKVQPADKSAPQSQADLKTRGEIIFSSAISSWSRSGLAYIWNIYIPVQQIFRFFCALHIIPVKTVKQDQLQSVIQFALGSAQQHNAKLLPEILKSHSYIQTIQLVWKSTIFKTLVLNNDMMENCKENQQYSNVVLTLCLDQGRCLI